MHKRRDSLGKKGLEAKKVGKSGGKIKKTQHGWRKRGIPTHCNRSYSQPTKKNQVFGKKKGGGGQKNGRLGLGH